MRRKVAIVAVAVPMALTMYLAAQEKAAAPAVVPVMKTISEDLTGPYDVIPNWFKPLPWHKGDWTYGLIAGVYAESADRVIVLTGGELPVPRTSAPPIARGAASNANHRRGNFVLVFNRNGEMIEDWSQWDHLFVRPHMATINPYDPEKHVWIIDDWADQIFEFTHDGKELVKTLGEHRVQGTDQKHFARETDIAWLPDGSFLVSDGYVGTRVIKFNKNGKFVSQFGSPGDGPGQLNLVHCVKTDARGRIYVADRDNKRLQVFDPEGKLLEVWSGIRRPSHLYMTQDQFVWMSDGEIGRMNKYDLTGKILTSWGTQGSFDGAFNNNHKFSVDPEGNLYVADYQNYRIQKFVPKKDADKSRLIGPRYVAPNAARK
jgi:DNA-binding beta-propeller fold protein YncE